MTWFHTHIRSIHAIYGSPRLDLSSGHLPWEREAPYRQYGLSRILSRFGGTATQSAPYRTHWESLCFHSFILDSFIGPLALCNATRDFIGYLRLVLHRSFSGWAHSLKPHFSFVYSFGFTSYGASLWTQILFTLAHFYGHRFDCHVGHGAFEWEFYFVVEDSLSGSDSRN